MKYSLLSIVLLVLLDLCSSDTINPSNDGQLVFAHVIFRHGDRNIAIPYASDPYKDEEKHWPGGFGQLTIEGKRQLYSVGQFFRRRYGKILGDKYSPNKIYIQSTDFDRTLMSAQASLAGLFPPAKDEKFLDNLDWAPIPVHTIPVKLDRNLLSEKVCPRYAADLERYMEESEKVKHIYTEYADLFQHLTQMSGQKITTIDDVYWLYDTLNIEKAHNKTLPNWAEKVIEANGTMEYIAKFNHKTYADTPQLARLQSGFLIKEMLERFSKKINSTLEPDRTVWLYSGHDVNILNVLNSLGLYGELHFPPYGSSLHIELYKAAENRHYIQIFYKRTEAEEYPLPMDIPNCGEKCPLDQFYKLYETLLPGDYDSECYF